MISPLVPKDADLRSYTWLKLDYARLFASEFFAMANDAEFRAAFILWCKSMQQLPAGSLPNNDKALAGWCGKSLKQWAKIKDMALHGWQEADDGRLYHPVLAEVVNDILSKDDAKPASNNHDDNKQDDISAKRSAAAKARWAAKNANDDASNASASCKTDANDMQNNNLHHANDMQNDANANFAYANEGGKGGDLDLNLEKDLDLNQDINSHTITREAEKKSSRFFDDELRPDLNSLNAKLGSNLITQKFIDENLFLFNSHYETQQLTDNQRLAKWIAWWKGEEAKKQAQTIQRPKTQAPKNQRPMFGNVNESFPLNPNDRPLTESEKAEIARMLEEDENVVF